MIRERLNSAVASQPLEKLAYTRREAAYVISQSPATLDRLTERGLLHPSRATRRPLYTREELLRFLRSTTGSID